MDTSRNRSSPPHNYSRVAGQSKMSACYDLDARVEQKKSRLVDVQPIQ